MRVLVLLAGLPPLAFAAAGCGDGDAGARSAGPAKAATVEVRTFMFRPRRLRIVAGTRVSWRNRDAIRHSATSGTRRHPTGRFDRLLDESDGTGAYRFRTPGTYRYFCRFHPGPGMRGVVVVRRR